MSTSATPPVAPGPDLGPLVDGPAGAPPPGAYLTSTQIWDALLVGMEPGRRYKLAELYELVATSCVLGPGDLERESARTSGPRWQRNVRNVLHRRKATAYLQWDGRGGFTLR